jgi:uncharacterized protein YecT (DUF1311 family)
VSGVSRKSAANDEAVSGAPIGRRGGSALGGLYNGFSTPARAPGPPPAARRRDPFAALMGGGVVVAALIGVGLGLRVESRPPPAVVPVAFTTPARASMASAVDASSKPPILRHVSHVTPAKPLAASIERGSEADVEPISPYVKRISTGASEAGRVRVHRLSPRPAAYGRARGAEPVRRVALITSYDGMREVEPDGPPRGRDDCRYTRTRAERLICRDPELAMLDRNLARAYDRALDSGVSRRMLRRDQRDWLAERDRAARFSGDAVYDVYVARIGELENLTEPSLSDGR